MFTSTILGESALAAANWRSVLVAVLLPVIHPSHLHKSGTAPLFI